MGPNLFKDLLGKCTAFTIPGFIRMPILKHYKEEGQPSRWGNPQASGRNPVGTRYTLADPPHEDSGFRIRQTEVEKHR